MFYPGAPAGAAMSAAAFAACAAPTFRRPATPCRRLLSRLAPLLRSAGRRRPVGGCFRGLRRSYVPPAGDAMSAAAFAACAAPTFRRPAPPCRRLLSRLAPLLRSAGRRRHVGGCFRGLRRSYVPPAGAAMSAAAFAACAAPTFRRPAPPCRRLLSRLAPLLRSAGRRRHVGGCFRGARRSYVPPAGAAVSAAAFAACAAPTFRRPATPCRRLLSRLAPLLRSAGRRRHVGGCFRGARRSYVPPAGDVIPAAAFALAAARRSGG
jgi:hypothetical protein